MATRLAKLLGNLLEVAFSVGRIITLINMGQTSLIVTSLISGSHTKHIDLPPFFLMNTMAEA